MKALTRFTKGTFLFLTLAFATVPFASGCVVETDRDEEADTLEGDSEDDVSIEPQLKGCVSRSCYLDPGWGEWSCSANRCIPYPLGGA